MLCSNSPLTPGINSNQFHRSEASLPMPPNRRKLVQFEKPETKLKGEKDRICASLSEFDRCKLIPRSAAGQSGLEYVGGQKISKSAMAP